MSEFIKTLAKMYKDKKNCENPPEYLKTVEELLKIENVIV